MFPFASMSSPPSTAIENRSRNGVNIAFLTVATVWPPRSIPIVSRIFSSFFWTLYSSAPEGSSSANVFRRRRTFPSTLKARSPASFSTQ